MNIITATPKLNAYDLSGSIEYGNYETLHVEGAMNAPLGETTALRAAFSVQSHDAYLTNGQQDEDVKSARIRTLFQPNDKFSFVLTGELSKTSDHTQNYVPQRWFDPDEVDDPWWSDTPLEDARVGNNKKIYGRMDMGLGFGTIIFLPSYGTSIRSGATYSENLGTITDYRNIEEKGGELRMSSIPDSSFTWIVGAYYYNSLDLLDQKAPDYELVAPYDYRVQYGTLEETSKALFGNITYPVTDRFRAIAGYRRSWSDVAVDRLRNGTMGGVIVQDVNKYDTNYSSPDYKLGVEYDLSESSMIYSNWATSYRAQGMQGMSGSKQTYPPPEKLNAYTAGSKNRFLNNKLQLNATAFYYDYKNYFVQQAKNAYYGTDLVNPTSQFVESDPNSYTWGTGHMMGADIQTSVIITPKDTLDLSASYLKTEWDDVFIDYYYDWEVTTRYMPGQIVPVTIIPLEDIDFSGKPMTHAPKYTVNAVYKHIFSLGNGGDLETQININYKGGYQLSWSDSDYPYNYQKSCYKIDLNAIYNNPDGKWSLSGYVRNLTNYAEKRYYSSRSGGQTGVGNPRTYGAVLSVRY